MADRDVIALEPFARLLEPLLRDAGAVVELHDLLVQAGDARTEAERAAWLEAFGTWLHHGRGIFGRLDDEERTCRLRAFVVALENVEPFRESFAALFTGVVSGLRGTKLFADVGIPVEAGFWREAADRIARRVLPTPPSPNSFADFIARLFPTEADARWLAISPPDPWLALWRLLETTKAPLSTAWMPLAGSMADAMRILAARIAGLAVAQDVRERLPDVPVSELPFLRLTKMCDAVQLGPPRMSFSNEAALSTIKECREALRVVHAHLEASGVSVDLVYRLELMTAQLARLEQITSLLVPGSFDELPVHLGRFTLAVVQAQFQGRSVLDLLRASSHLLARKIVERSGKTGEHYITQTRAEWRAMLFSAAGGGFLTTYTAAFKFLVSGSALFACINFAGSFLLMGALGFTLATKQPSMTAAALAASLEPPGPEGAAGLRRSRIDASPLDQDALSRLVGLIAAISRSQLAAAAGNVLTVIPAAIAFDLLWRLFAGHTLLGEEKATKVVHSLSIIHSGTMAYAAFTGVLLWLSSVAAGWFENWITYRRLPAAIEAHRTLRRVLGPARTKRLARALEHGASSVAGSIALGVLLGIVPSLGLPLEVRHVTLSTGSLVFAASALGGQGLAPSQWIEAALGIVVIGILNFGVSFVLALGVALRARDTWRTGTTRMLRRLAGALVRRFVREPLPFFLPPRG